MYNKCSAFLDFKKKQTEINSLTDFTFSNSSRCDETEVIAFAFDVGSNFINCEYFLKDENILVHFYDMKNVACMSALQLTSLLHEQEEIVEEEFALWIVVDFIKLQREESFE